MGATRNEKESYKSTAIKAAKDLGYGLLIVKQIEMAKTDAEIERIMVTARHEHFGND